MMGMKQNSWKGL